jgi:monoamine oxidase
MKKQPHVFINSLSITYSATQKNTIYFPTNLQHFKIVTGAQSISTRLSERLSRSGVSVLLNTRVHAIRNGPLESVPGPAIVYSSCSSDGPSEFHATRVVMALSPPVASSIDIFPACPQRQMLNRAMSMGACVKTIAVYPDAFWRTAPSVFSEDIHYSQMGPVANIFDATIGGKPALVGLVVGDTAREWSSKVGSALLADTVAQQYARMFLDHRALRPACFVAKSWIEVR